MFEIDTDLHGEYLREMNFTVMRRGGQLIQRVGNLKTAHGRILRASIEEHLDYAFALRDRQYTTQGVWKPDGTTMRRVTADPSGAFDRLCDYHGADERVYHSDTF